MKNVSYYPESVNFNASNPCNTYIIREYPDICNHIFLNTVKMKIVMKIVLSVPTANLFSFKNKNISHYINVKKDKKDKSGYTITPERKHSISNKNRYHYK